MWDFLFGSLGLELIWSNQFDETLYVLQQKRYYKRKLCRNYILNWLISINQNPNLRAITYSTFTKYTTHYAKLWVTQQNNLLKADRNRWKMSILYYIQSQNWVHLLYDSLDVSHDPFDKNYNTVLCYIVCNDYLSVCLWILFCNLYAKLISH